MGSLGEVAVAVSFEEGEGDTFTASPISIRVYPPPSISQALPCCAPAVQPTRVLLKATTPGALFDAPHAKAFFYDEYGKGAVFASVAATYSPEDDAMVVDTPLTEEAQPKKRIWWRLNGAISCICQKERFSQFMLEILNS